MIPKPPVNRLRVRISIEIEKQADRTRAARTAEPLGSISRPETPTAAGTEACLRCGETAVMRIRMTFKDGRPGVFVSCPSCEQTNWFALGGDGTPVPRAEALGGDR